jgi:Family of unknown function (DUF5678)
LSIVHLDGAAERDYNGVVRNPAESGTMEPLRLSEMLRGLEGKWVAIKDGEVVEAADNADALFKRMRSKRIQDASVLRAPTEKDHEAELVGLG